MGKPAARITDMHVCPKVNPGPVPHVGGPIAMGSPSVMIGGLPAARVGDMAICVGPPDKISAGSSGVLINGKPAARLGDSTAHGGKIVVGSPTVLIGDGGGGGDGGGKGDHNINLNVHPGFPVGVDKAGDALRKALIDQRKMLESKLKELNTWDAAAQQNFKKWFGTTDEESKQVIKKRIEKTLELNQNTTEANFKPAAPENNSAYAYVYPDDKNHTVYLGDPFWNAPDVGRDSKAGVLTHEMSHFDDVGGTDDYKYGEAKSLELAENYPERALNNADSFEYYVEGG
jgi:uncharacterized Zn-binding protein involved in type VI secretion